MKYKFKNIIHTYHRVRIKQSDVQNRCFEINTFLVFKELYFFVKYPPPHKPLVRFLDVRLFDSLLSVSANVYDNIIPGHEAVLF